jgi:hypothetical protein
VPIVLKSGSLSLLETSGPVKACDEITVPLHVSTLTDPQGALIRCLLSYINVSM